MFEYFVGGVLALIALSGAVGIPVILLMGVMRRRSKKKPLTQRRKHLLRELFQVVIGVALLGLFYSRQIDSWTALISASVLLVLFEYAVAAAEKLRPELLS